MDRTKPKSQSNNHKTAGIKELTTTSSLRYGTNFLTPTLDMSMFPYKYNLGLSL